MSNVDYEKHASEHHEDHVDVHGKAGDINGEDAIISAQDIYIDPVLEKKTMRQIDLRLIPILAAMYSISLIDRTNISAARVAGMAVDLQLTVGERYSIISLAFFPPYILLELPSNILLRKFGARYWLTFISMAWGAVTIGMGFLKTWEGLVACRVLLGVLEAGFFPACAFLISCWYKRYEVGKRMSTFYVLSTVVSGFSSALGYAISLLAGNGGLNGWSWIFIIYGIITMVLGILVFIFVVDFPDKNTFLRPEQTQLVIDRLQKDRGDGVYDGFHGSSVLKDMLDFKLWLFGICFFCATIVSYALAYFLPVVLAGMGYSTKDSLIYTSFPYICVPPFAIGLAWVGDKYHMRGPIVAFQSLVALIGMAMLGYSANSSVRYGGAFLACMGANANVPSVLSYMNNAIAGQSKRGVGSAIAIGFGGIGGIAASLVFRQQDYPQYTPGCLASIVSQAVTILICGCLSVFFMIQNKKARAGEIVIENRKGFFYTI